MFTHLYRQSISCILSSVLLGNVLYADGIVVDSAAAASHRPTMESTANAIPLINIVTPNSTGLSHNKFSEFNIEQRGVIFNNATSAVQTQLGGWVQGNANLGTTPARVILNEVTGTNRSLLQGYGEVAGHRADLIIANPNGITVNGGGFINTNRVTLTTGTPELSGGVLNGFHVRQGEILIEGEGLNADNIDRVELYTKALQLNAKLYAKALDVVTGENTITRDGAVTSDNITGSGYSIDSSALGGIYGDTIRLVGTDKGVGVNLPPVTYASDSLSLSADGKITLGQIVADKAINVVSQSSDIAATNDISASDISISAQNNMSISTDRVVKALNNMSISAGESITNDGELNALLGTGTTHVHTSDLLNNGLIGGYDVVINSETIDNVGALYAKNDLSLEGKSLNNSGVIRSNQDMDLLIEDTLGNRKGGTIYSDGALTIAANGAKDKINTIDNYGVIQSGGNLNITAQTLNNLADAPVIKTVISTTEETISQGGSNDYDKVTVTTTTDVVDVPNDPALILSTGDMSIDTQNINNFYSLIASDKDMVLNADNVKNVGNVLVNTVVTVIKKYRDERYCSRRVLGACVSHKHRAGYRGTWTTQQSERTPLSNSGIIAKNSIYGNIVTLSNLSDQLNGVLGAEQILANLSAIDELEARSALLQELTLTLENAHEALAESVGEESTIEAIIADAIDNNDLSIFHTNMTLLQSDLDQEMRDNSDLANSLEALILTIKAENTAYDTTDLELRLSQFKNNITSAQQHLDEIETLRSSMGEINDLQTKKETLLAIDYAIRTLVSDNTESLANLDITPLTSGFETASDTLRAEVNTALALQENVEYKIITQDEGLYQTNLHRNLTSNPAIAYSESAEAIIEGITLPQGKYGLFLVNQEINHPYLIEANPLYTDYNTFISSNYILERLGFDPDHTLKRLGDGAYETQLVRDSVIRLSGNRYLGDYASDAEQYQALMDNALRIQSEFGLVVGVELTQDQVARLDDNIVWLEERTIEGVKVLVPRVYLASTTLRESGPKIAANTINLTIGNTLTNDGVIRASDTLSLSADTIKNINGSLSSGGDMVLQAQSDLRNTSGTITSGGDMSLRSGGAITSDTTSQEIQYQYARGVQTTTQKGKSSLINAGGALSLEADQTIKMSNAEVTANENITMVSKNGDINVNAQKTDDAYSFKLRNGYNKGDSTTYESTNITGKNITLNANTITIDASSINAKEDLSVTAKEGVELIARNDHIYTDTKIKSSNGFVGSKVQQDTVYKESTVGTTLNAQNITITSTNDTTLQAANLKAQENIQIDAGGEINIVAKEYREGELHYTKKSDFGGLVSSASLDSSDAVKLHEATLKTEAKNIIMNSGKDINIIASEVTSAADVALKAFENLNIIAGEEAKSEKHESQKSSFNLVNLATGIATLGLVNTGAIYTNEVHNKDNYDTTAKSSSITAGGNIVADTGTTNIIGSNLSAGDDVAIKADIGGINITSAQELHNASQLDKKTEVKLGDIVTSVTEGIQGLSEDNTKLKVNVASATFDESTTTAQSVTNVASSITSGKNVTLDSSDDIAIKGSDITARETIDLKSKTGNISITESVDTTNTQSSEKHASAEVNLVVQNEFVEAAVAVDNAVKAAEQLKQTKEDYSNYKRELKKLEASLDTLKKDPQVSESDIANLQGLIAATKDDEAYYIAAIAAATVNLASKTVAIAQQANAAGASTATAGFSAGLSLDMKGSQSTTDTTATRSNASNLSASNINIATDNTEDTSVTVSGSNINAADTLNISTHDLNVIASTDTATTNSSSKDISGSISMTVYGAASGPQVSLGYGQNESRSSSTTHTNSTLTGNTVNIDVTNDATFKGATVRADEALNVNVGNNLEVASVQDTSSSSNHGMNISGGFGFGNDPAYSSPDKTTQGTLNQSVGLRTGDGTIASVNGGVGASNERRYDTQTVLTSLTGDSVNITTGANTKLSGAVIAATDANGNDTGKLNLTTNTLTTENLTDTHYNSATGFSVGGNIGLTPTAKDPKPDTKDAETPSGTKLNSEHIAFNTSTDTSVGKTLATVGEGTITITDPRHSVLDTESKETLNRDVTKVDKELYSSSTGTKVDATIDNRLLTEKGRAQIAEDFEKTKRLGEAAYETATEKSVSLIADQADGQTSFADRLNDKEALVQASKIIASQENSQLLATLTNPNATDEQKQQAYQSIVSTLSEQMGISTSEVKLILSNGEKGGYSSATDTTYIATNAQASSGDAVNTSAHETSHSADAIRDAGIQTTDNYTINREEYATLTGDDFQRYLNNALESNGYGSLDTITDNRYGTTTTSPTLQANTVEFNSLEDMLYRGLDDYTNKPSIKVANGVYNAKDVPTMPDYVSVASNSKLKIFNGNIALNLHNGEFFLGGAGVLPSDGKFTPIVTKNGFSLLFGYIDRDDFDRGKLTNDFLGGMGGQGTICAYGLCGGVNVSSDKTIATEVGIGSAGIGISAGGSSSISNLK